MPYSSTNSEKRVHRWYHWSEGQFTCQKGVRDLYSNKRFSSGFLQTIDFQLKGTRFTRGDLPLTLKHDYSDHVPRLISMKNLLGESATGIAHTHTTLLFTFSRTTTTMQIVVMIWFPHFYSYKKSTESWLVRKWSFHTTGNRLLETIFLTFQKLGRRSDYCRRRGYLR